MMMFFIVTAMFLMFSGLGFVEQIIPQLTDESDSKAAKSLHGKMGSRKPMAGLNYFGSAPNGQKLSHAAGDFRQPEIRSENCHVNDRTERQPPRRDNARDSRQPGRVAEARDFRTAKRGGCSLQ
jgi:hypothetical protein